MFRVRRKTDIAFIISCITAFITYRNKTIGIIQSFHWTEGKRKLGLTPFQLERSHKGFSWWNVTPHCLFIIPPGEWRFRYVWLVLRWRHETWRTSTIWPKWEEYPPLPFFLLEKSYIPSSWLKKSLLYLLELFLTGNALAGIRNT